MTASRVRHTICVCNCDLRLLGAVEADFVSGLVNQPHGKPSVPLRLRAPSQCDNSNLVGLHLVFSQSAFLDLAQDWRDTSRASSSTRLCSRPQFAISLMYLSCRVQPFLLTVVHQRCQHVVFGGSLCVWPCSPLISSDLSFIKQAASFILGAHRCFNCPLKQFYGQSTVYAV